MVTKTVHDIVQEYVKRQENPKYEEMDVRTYSGSIFCYTGVTHIHEEFDDTGKWIVFYSKCDGKTKLVKIRGSLGDITRSVEFIEE